MITAEELATKSAHEVRYSSELYRAFELYYKQKVGGNCSSCSFLANWNKFVRAMNPPIYEHKLKVMSTNTFKLKNEKELIYVPFSAGTVITKDSPDEDVIAYLNQKGSRVNTAARLEKFAVLPKAMRAEEKKSITAEETPEDLESLTLAELRQRFPEVSARSKSDFISKIK